MVDNADDVAVVGTAHTGTLFEEVMNPGLKVVNAWMSKNGLTIAPHKTEAVLLTNKWAYVKPKLTVAGHEVNIQKSFKYLGVIVDQRLNFNEHIARAAKSASDAARVIGRLMPNITGPSLGKRRLLASVINARLLYASSTWANTGFKTAINRRIAESAKRLAALRISRAYMTVSSDAILIIAKTLPADLHTAERARIRLRRTVGGHNNMTAIKKEERTGR